MLESKELFDKVIKNFPRWMDIRKRSKKSDGGNFLLSIIEEFDEIENAINEYKKDFFAINYIGREDEIIDYLYVAEIGDIDIESFELTSPFSNHTENTKEFYLSKEPIALIKNERILVKIKDIKDGEDLTYSVGKFNYKANYRKIHIWNVIDEFALFMSLERYENETNKELLNRVFLASQRPTNSTEQGLKNAIKNAVANFSSLSDAEIGIMPLTHENLYIELDNGLIIDHLSEVNRDVFRSKYWDVNRWEHPFKNLKYSPHGWDIEPKKIQDGVGHSDSLKATLISEIENGDVTSVEIDVYEKSEYQINEYIRQHRLETGIELELKKYSDVIKPSELEYKIVAKEVAELDASVVNIESFKSESGENDYYIEDLIADPSSIQDITIERGRLEKDFKYGISFKASKEYQDMKIEKCEILKNGASTNLLKENGVFKFGTNGEIYNSNVRLHCNSVKDFTDFENLSNLKSGFTLSDASRPGTGKIDIAGMGNQFLKIEHECRESNIIRDRNLVKTTGFFLNESGELQSEGREGEIAIELDCNQLFYEMAEGNCIVTKTIDGKVEPSEIWFEPKSERLNFDSTKKVKILIRKLSNDSTLKMKNIRYSRYDIDVYLEKGNFIKTPMGTILPNVDENSLSIHVRAHTGFAPVINFIHIGASLKNAVYKIEPFAIDSDDTFLRVQSDCAVELVKLDSGDNIIETVNNFISKNKYRNEGTESRFIEIDTRNFLDIKTTYPSLEQFSSGSKVSNYIKLAPGDEIDKITINGDFLMLLEKSSLESIIGSEPLEKVYGAGGVKGFIVAKDKKEKLVKLKRELFNKAADCFKVTGLPDGVRSMFVIDERNNTEIAANFFDKRFESLYIMSINEQEHVAYNRRKMVRPELDNISIVDVFSPAIQRNRLMLYTIEEIKSDNIKATVMFEKISGTGDASLDSWSLGKKTLKAELIYDKESSNMYESESIKLKKSFVLSNSIDLDDHTLPEIKEELAKYVIIPPDGMRVSHENKVSEYEIVAIKEDGFNKLKYSNIGSIIEIKKADGSLVSDSKFRLLKEEGIILWEDVDLFGEIVTIRYRYGVPRYILFTDLDKLYKIVGYKTEAYRKSFTKTLEKMSDGEISEEIKELLEADRIITFCKNPNFRAVVENGTVSTFKITENNKVAVKTGVFYQDGQEYYHYVNKSTNMLERHGNLELHETKRLGDSLELFQKSKNLMPNSSMDTFRLGELCIADFKNNENIDGISSLNSLTACDTYGEWIAFNMSMELTEGLNSLGTKFTPIDDNSYSILDLTRFLKKGMKLSLHTTGNLSIYIGEGEKYKGANFGNTILVKSLKEMKKEMQYRYFEFDKESFKEDTRYYLVIRGTGVIDDMISTMNKESKTLESLHTKKIDALGLEIKEAAFGEYLKNLPLGVHGHRLDRLEFSDETLRTGTSINWGLTKIEEFKGRWEECFLRDIENPGGLYVKALASRIGEIETKSIYVRNRNSVRNLVVKINELILPEDKGFEIELLTASSGNGTFQLAGTIRGSHVLVVPQTRISNYIRVRAILPSGATVNNLEIFAEYYESDSPLSVGNHQNGQITTKIFDIGHNGDLKIKEIKAEGTFSKENIEIYARALRRDRARVVWTEWKEGKLDDELKILNDLEFLDYRYLQFRLVIKKEETRIKINGIKLEVKN